MRRAPAAVLLLLCAGACSTAKIDMNEPRRVVGTENAVRVDAEITGEDIRNGGRVPITYVVTNDRPTTIAIADLIPETTYDPDSQTITVNIGSEVPGLLLLPRLLTIAPGEKKTFRTTARVAFALPRQRDANQADPMTGFRLRINFLGDTSGGFQQLIGIPERSIANTKLADELFPLWVERNEVVYTNAVPMHWKTTAPEAGDVASPRTAPVRRRP